MEVKPPCCVCGEAIRSLSTTLKISPPPPGPPLHPALPFEVSSSDRFGEWRTAGCELDYKAKSLTLTSEMASFRSTGCLNDPTKLGGVSLGLLIRTLPLCG